MLISEIDDSSYLDVVDDLFLGFGRDNTFETWNQAVVEVTGYSDAELATMSPADFFEEPVASRVTEALANAFETDKTVIEANLLTADGSRVPYEFNIHRVPEDRSVAVVALGRDVSARKEPAREQLKHRETVLRELYQITADRDRSFTDQVETLLALGRRELDTEYGSFSEIRKDECIFEVVDAVDESIAAGDVVPVEATKCEITASQEQTLVLGDISRDAPEETDRVGYTDLGISCYVGAPVYDDDGVYGTFCFYDTEPRNGQFSDWEVTLVDLMSRWVAYELQRRQTIEQRKQQNERLDQFAGIVSHDLRNPLTALHGWLDLAEETGDPEHFNRCYRSIDRMETLIDDLLTLARNGSEIDDAEPVAPGQLARVTWEFVGTAGGTLSIDTDQTVMADRSRLRQLLENLFRNAVEHGGDEVAVTVGELDNGFYVADDGRGIPADERGVVFEESHSTTPNGTGFGLTIVQEIIEAHGWKIRITESATGGARFEITGVDLVA